CRRADVRQTTDDKRRGIRPACLSAAVAEASKSGGLTMRASRAFLSFAPFQASPTAAYFLFLLLLLLLLLLPPSPSPPPPLPRCLLLRLRLIFSLLSTGSVAGRCAAEAATGSTAILSGTDSCPLSDACTHTHTHTGTQRQTDVMSVDWWYICTTNLAWHPSWAVGSLWTRLRGNSAGDDQFT
ncbi:unnamed protein product, partial [Protopolystoma xenopodis]